MVCPEDKAFYIYRFHLPSLKQVPAYTDNWLQHYDVLEVSMGKNALALQVLRLGRDFTNTTETKSFNDGLPVLALLWTSSPVPCIVKRWAGIALSTKPRRSLTGLCLVISQDIVGICHVLQTNLCLSNCKITHF